MAAQIFLVRHGRSTHASPGLLNLAQFHRWRVEYEAAGLDEQEPTPEVRTLAVSSGVVVSSPALRAVQSAKLLDAERTIETSPLLHELELQPPRVPLIRMPLIGWALAFGARWIVRAALRRPHYPDAEVQRAREAAAWLSELAQRHGSVLAVTHSSLRSLVAEQLVAQGWTREIPRGRFRVWSVWRLRR